MAQPREIKRWHWLVIAAMMVSAVGLRLYHLRWPRERLFLAVQGFSLTVRVASTPEHRYEGWSNQKDMGADEGMLFLFDARGNYVMVMRQMLFPLDIIWIDGSIIVDLAASAQPEPGQSEARLKRYASRAPADKVLEVPAGFTRQFGIKIGDSVMVSGR